MKRAIFLFCIGLASMLGASSSAQTVIYENAGAFTGQRTTAVNEIPMGDIITFAAGDRAVTTVSFEYFLSPGGSGNETAVFQLWVLEGSTVNGQQLPGNDVNSLFYTSEVFSIASGTTPEGYGTANIDLGGLSVRDSMAFTVTFRGLEGNETAGLLFHNDLTPIGTNPTIFDSGTGQQEHFSIRRSGSGGLGTWEVLNHDGVVDNFGLQITAVPEPSTSAVLAVGLCALLFRRIRSK
jgi:hypothetical protein